jgi:hypothetical protein
MPEMMDVVDVFHVIKRHMSCHFDDLVCEPAISALFLFFAGRLVAILAIREPSSLHHF